MDPTEKDLLIRLAASLKQEDLKDPTVEATVRMLLDTLDPKPEPLPPEMVAQLQVIPVTQDRFMAAAEMVGAMDQTSLDRLAAAMQAVGLLSKNQSIVKLDTGVKPDDDALERARKVDLIGLPDSVEGTNCSNCRFVKKQEDSYQCTHEDVRQSVGPRMCCSVWDADGVKRSWE